jgi:hypothetical protein
MPTESGLRIDGLDRLMGHHNILGGNAIETERA